MFKNYFFLLRSVNYLDKILSGARIIDIYSQEKNKLFLHLPSDENPYRHLIISTNPHSPYLLIKNIHHKAKKNVVDFFSDYLPSKLIEIKIATNDRLINFTFDSFNLYFSISGNKTNVYLIVNSKIEGFKKIKEPIFEKINSKIFTNDLKLTFIENDKNNYNEMNALKRDFPMISGEIKREIIFRSSSDPSKSIFEIFKEICIEILRNKIKIGFSDEEQKFVFIPESFIVYFS